MLLSEQSPFKWALFFFISTLLGMLFDYPIIIYHYFCQQMTKEERKRFY